MQFAALVVGILVVILAFAGLATQSFIRSVGGCSCSPPAQPAGLDCVHFPCSTKNERQLLALLVSLLYLPVTFLAASTLAWGPTLQVRPPTRQPLRDNERVSNISSPLIAGAWVPGIH